MYYTLSPPYDERNTGLYILMTKRCAIVFIDGNNWYHRLKNISTSRDVSFKRLTEFVCKKFNLILKDIYFYNSRPDISDGKENYYKQMSFFSSLEKEGIKVRTRKLQKSSNKEVIEKKHLEINNLKLCPKCLDITKNNCSLCIKPFKKKEKGIDVKIAVDMISKSVINGECDCCILISGDGDFIPAMQVIKDSGKEALSSALEGRGYSNKLRQGKQFRYLIISIDDLAKNYFNNPQNNSSA